MTRLSLILFIGLAWTTSALAQAQSASEGTVNPSGAKRTLQANSKAEYKDYTTASSTRGGPAMEKAADGFAATYPASELRAYLYSKAMHEYQLENNNEKMNAMGEKVLELDPDNSVALVLTATVLSDNLGNSGEDRAGKVAEIKRNVDHALQTIDAAFQPSPGMTPDQIAGYKSTLRSMAHSALGVMELKTGDDAGAEKDLRLAAKSESGKADPYIWYHLTLALHHQGKYSEALASASQALQTAGSNEDLAQASRREKEQLEKLAVKQALSEPSPQPPASQAKPPK